ncbi:hypothetical protein KFE25_004486 [Diacronema lutheri]|uniref:Solute carrier family 40 protein n=1 Tax=Diacronema lutheri TaxID=2081491 RepID=A0A8J6CA89_DIALT|nr:hypothetical protein KFE25_004486 [Diacronema lutheri]
MSAERGVHALLASHLLSAWGDQMWQFAVPVLIAELFDSPIAAAASFNAAVFGSCVVTVPALGAWLDRTERLGAVRTALLASNACIAAVCALLALLPRLAPPSRVGFGVACALALALSCAAEAMGRAKALALTRDWVVQLCATDGARLASLNIVMQRIDLCAKVLAPALVGVALGALGTVGAADGADARARRAARVRLGAVLVGAWNVLSLPAELALTAACYRAHRAQLARPCAADVAAAGDADGADARAHAEAQVHAHADGTVHAHVHGLQRHAHPTTPPAREHGGAHGGGRVHIDEWHIHARDEGSCAEAAITDARSSDASMRAADAPGHARSPPVERALGEMMASPAKGTCGRAGAPNGHVPAAPLRCWARGVAEPQWHEHGDELHAHAHDPDANVHVILLLSRADDSAPDVRARDTERGSGVAARAARGGGGGACAPCARAQTAARATGARWRAFFAHPVAGASVAFCLLFLTVLDNGTLVATYLLSQGVRPAVLGAAHAADAAAGLLGTVAFAPLVARLGGGVERAGLASIWAFWLTLAPAGALFAAAARARAGEPGDVGEARAASVRAQHALLGCMVCARAALWSFDLAHTQSMQQRVEAARRGAMGGCQVSLSNAAYVLVQLAALGARRPEQFGALLALSLGAVLAAALLYTVWFATVVRDGAGGSCCGQGGERARGAAGLRRSGASGGAHGGRYGAYGEAGARDGALRRAHEGDEEGADGGVQLEPWAPQSRQAQSAVAGKSDGPNTAEAAAAQRPVSAVDGPRCLANSGRPHGCSARALGEALVGAGALRSDAPTDAH